LLWGVTFHTKGESWGTSSSSMNGLAQSEIYSTVRSECKAIYINSCYGASDLDRHENEIHTFNWHSAGTSPE